MKHQNLLLTEKKYIPIPDSNQNLLSITEKNDITVPYSKINFNNDNTNTFNNTNSQNKSILPEISLNYI